MPLFNDAANEAFATARTNDPVLSTLEVSHVSLDRNLYLIADRQSRALPLELGADPVLFEAAGLEIGLPATNQDGVQDMSFSISNINLKASDFFREALKFPEFEILLTFRPYLLSDLTQPSHNAPLSLSVAGVQINSLQVDGSASLAGITDRQFLTELYTEERFPSL